MRNDNPLLTTDRGINFQGPISKSFYGKYSQSHHNN